jgi:hypothetical protein
VAAYALALTVDPEWVHWRRSFGQLGVGAPAGVGFRLLALASAVALTVGFLAVVPGRRTWFTRFGSASMYVYLLHGFVTLFLSYQGWYYRISGAELALVTVGCAALAVVLASGPLRGAFRWAVEPRLDWLFHPRVPPPAGAVPRPAGAGEHGPPAGPGRAGAVRPRDPAQPPPRRRHGAPPR